MPTTTGLEVMVMLNKTRDIKGKWEYLLGWMIGIPIPILILIYLIRGN